MGHKEITGEKILTTLDKVIAQLPRLSQRQNGLNEQLFDLTRIANKLGMYDAADFISREITKSKRDESIEES
jgi:hypothetical protein